VDTDQPRVIVITSNSSTMSPIPAPRLCHLVIRDNFDGYGFNLFKKKNTPGQYIGSIDVGSPAEFGGLKEGDKLVEVNGENVTMENHKQVVQRIREVPTEVTLLIVDKECEEYHIKKKIKITNLLPEIIHISSEKDIIGSKHEDTQSTLSALSIKGEEAAEEEDKHISRDECTTQAEVLERSDSNSSLSSSEKTDNSVSTDSARSTPSPTIQNADMLNLPLTAKEMRERIEKKKKKDPRKEENGDWWKKHMIIQEL